MKQYIDKADVVAEINRALNSYDPNEITSGRYALTDLRDFLDTLEVKEVNLEKEIISQIRLLNGVHTLYNNKQWWKGTYNELSYFAKHFFELGLKSRQ